MSATICGHMDPTPVPLKAISTADWDGAGIGRKPDFRLEVAEGLIVLTGIKQKYCIQFETGAAIYLEGELHPSPNYEFADGTTFLPGYLFYRTPGADMEMVAD